MAMADVNGGERDVSLIALTSHFAQVQFRLKQITSSPAEHREGLLRQLEEFAFQGCPVKLSYDSSNEEDHTHQGEEQNQLQQLLNSLQSQLAELNGAPPTSPASFDKQTIVLDELSKRFDMQFEDLDSLSEDEVRVRVNEAIAKKQRSTQKDIVVRQLVSQVRSMEEHISLLQSELATLTHSPTPYTEAKSLGETSPPQYHISWCQDSEECLLSLHQASSEESLVTPSPVTLKGSGRGRRGKRQPKGNEGVESLQRTLALMQILTLWGCGGRFKFTSKKPSQHINEYPKAVRSLELAVDKISLIVTALNEPGIKPVNSARLESELFEAVSMSLSDSLCELFEHGWEGQLQAMPTSCMPPMRWFGVSKLDMKSEDCVAWQTINYYYYVKKGPQVCDKPEMKLSSSFCLPVDSSLKPKQTLLSCVYHANKCFSSCQHYHTDLKFRSFVCQGFNLHHLLDWVRLVVTHPSLIDDLYRTSSFMAITRFRPVLQILERLSNLPSVSPVTLPSSYFHHIN